MFISLVLHPVNCIFISYWDEEFISDLMIINTELSDVTHQKKGDTKTVGLIWTTSINSFKTHILHCAVYLNLSFQNIHLHKDLFPGLQRLYSQPKLGVTRAWNKTMNCLKEICCYHDLIKYVWQPVSCTWCTYMWMFTCHWLDPKG